MYRIFQPLVIATLLLTWSVSSPAAPAQGACRDDIKTLCAGVKPGGGAIAHCLKEHEADLSKGCREQRALKQEQFAEIRTACKGDMEVVCKGVKPGAGRLWACLKSNQSAVSEGCRNAMEHARDQD